MAYVDGFLLAVPTKNVEDYKKIARKVGKIYMDHGAVEYRETVADDVKSGKLTSFPQAVKMKPTETVVFSYIGYKTRAHRDRVQAKVMADRRMKEMMNPADMPFDGKRMVFGGFETLVAMQA